MCESRRCRCHVRMRSRDMTRGVTLGFLRRQMLLGTNQTNRGYAFVH